MVTSITVKLTTHLHAGIEENLVGHRQVFLQLRHVLLPVQCRYSAVTVPVQCRYITVTVPLEFRHRAVTVPSSYRQCHYCAVTVPVQYHHRAPYSVVAAPVQCQYSARKGDRKRKGRGREKEPVSLSLASSFLARGEGIKHPSRPQQGAPSEGSRSYTFCFLL